jgi:hypothetical protein
MEHPKPRLRLGRLQYIFCFYVIFIRLHLVANVKPVTKYNDWCNVTKAAIYSLLPLRVESVLFYLRTSPYEADTEN